MALQEACDELVRLGRRGCFGNKSSERRTTRRADVGRIGVHDAHDPDTVCVESTQRPAFPEERLDAVAQEVARFARRGEHEAAVAHCSSGTVSAALLPSEPWQSADQADVRKTVRAGSA